MKTTITSLLAVALLCSCATAPTAVVNTGITLGVGTGLQFVTDPAKRTAIANYIEVYAGALRTITGSPTPAQLAAQINAFIPASVKASQPEIASFVTPLVVSAYQALYAKYGTSGNAAAIYAGLNQFATDLEAGAAPYISH